MPGTRFARIHWRLIPQLSFRTKTFIYREMIRDFSFASAQKPHEGVFLPQGALIQLVHHRHVIFAQMIIYS